MFKEDLAKPTLPAVFCDEAQDFTRVELELIFRLNLFTDRKLDQSSVNRVPFVFAGDPFQTLNPTGFRWEAIKASFHEKLEDFLDTKHDGGISLNYKELKWNYRSSRNIVKICNYIQLIRSSIFKIYSVSPQKSWTAEIQSPIPSIFNTNETEKWSSISNEDDIMIIVPCNLDEEIEFVKNDEYLSKILKTDEIGVAKNVFSPARAKGLERPRVAVYGFGGKAQESILDLLVTDNSDRNKLLKYEYFLNQLYVAISRPKRQLYIIDNKQGKEHLWKHLLDDEFLDKLFEYSKNDRDKWKEKTGSFNIGSKECLSKDRGNPEETAKKMKETGLLRDDPFFLRSAAMTYENIGQDQEALLCKAKALFIEEKFEKSGDKYKLAHDSSKALEAYWKAGRQAKAKILELIDIDETIEGRLEYKLVETTKNITFVKILNRFNEICDRLKSEKNFKWSLKREQSYSEVVRTYLNCIIDKFSNEEQIKKVIPSLDYLLEFDSFSDHIQLAEIYYLDHQLKKSVELWEKTPEKCTSIKNYAKAKTIILVEAFTENSNMIINETDRLMLLEHFRKQGDYLFVAKCYMPSLLPEGFEDFLERIPKGYLKMQDIWIELISYFMLQNEWELVAEIGYSSCAISKHEKGIKRRYKPILERLMKEKNYIRNAIVITAARSEEFHKRHISIRRLYADYFKRTLLDSSIWQKVLTLEVAGAAIEKAGWHTDILPFYENVSSSSDFSKKEKRFADIRWLVTKEQQAKRERETGNEEAARRHKKEADSKRILYGLSGVKAPEFPRVENVWVQRPDIPIVNISEDKPTKIEEKIDIVKTETIIKIEDFEIVFNPGKDKINIKEIISMNTAGIRYKKKQFSSIDVEIKQKEGNLFVCDEWNCSCRFIETENLAILSFTNLSFSLSFNFGKD